MIGLIVTAGFSAYALAAPKARTEHAFTETLVGAEISAHGNSAVEVFKTVSSLDGTCATIAHDLNAGTTFPISGTDAVTTYCKDGVLKTASKYVLNAPNSNGIIAYTGSGKCVAGAGVHKKEKCTYTFKGTFNTKTNIDKAKFTGTATL